MLAYKELNRREALLSTLSLFPELDPRIETTFLMYHRVSFWNLKNDVLGLLQKGLKPLSPQDFVQALKSKITIPKFPSTFILTFDDGLKSQFTEGLRALEEIEKETRTTIPAIFFVIAKFNDPDVPLERVAGDTPSYYSGVNSYLTKDQIIELIRRGYSVQNHTVNHPDLTVLSEGARNAEIVTAEERINVLYQQAGEERKVKIFGHPYGVFTKETEETLKVLGFDAALATSKGLEPSFTNRFKIKRYSRS